MNRNSQVFIGLSALWWMIARNVEYQFSQKEISQTINGWHSELLDSLMTIITMGGEFYFIFPFLVLCVCVFKGKKFFWPILLAVAIAAIVPSVCTNLLKSYFNAPRPLTVFEGESWMHIIPDYKNNYKKSFPSGHTTGAFACFAIGAYLSGRRSVLLPILFFIAAVAVGISRVYLLQHFWQDILWGSLIGTVVALICLMIYQRIHKKGESS